MDEQLYEGINLLKLTNKSSLKRFLILLFIIIFIFNQLFLKHKFWYLPIKQVLVFISVIH